MSELQETIAPRYVGELGVSWCVRHHGVINEDSDRCDAHDWDPTDVIEDGPDEGEPTPCEPHELVYIADPEDGE